MNLIFFLFEDLLDGFRNLIIDNIFDVDAGKNILDQNIKLERIVKSELADGIDAQSFYQYFSLLFVI